MTRPNDTPLAAPDDGPGKTPDATATYQAPQVTGDGKDAGRPEDRPEDGQDERRPRTTVASEADPEQPRPLLRLGSEHAPTATTPPAPQPETVSDPDAPEDKTDTPRVVHDPEQPSVPDPDPVTRTENDPANPDECAPASESPASPEGEVGATDPSLTLWALSSDLASDSDTAPEFTPDTGPDIEVQPLRGAAASPPSAVEVPRSEPVPGPIAAPVRLPAPRSRPACEAALFGKLPTRGDFIARNMPRLLQRPFEDWLIPLVQETRKELGAHWTSHWRGAGPWRFWIGPDVLGGSWQRDLRKPAHEQAAQGGAVTGVLLPSADRHGRDFPLVVVLADPLARLMPPPVTASPDRGWYDLCDELLYAARGGNEITTIETALDRLPGPLLPEGAEEMAALLDQRALWAQGSEVLEDGTSRIWRDIAAADHHLAATSRSYWWQAPRAGATQRVLSLAGLPDAGSFAFMLAQGHPDASDSLQ